VAVLKLAAAGNVPPNGGAERLQRPVLISVAGHVALLLAVLWGALVGFHGSTWGESGAEGGGAAAVTLVSAASVPLPPPSVVTTNKIANEEPGLHYAEAPKPQPKPVPEKAVELPGRNAKQAPPKSPIRPREEAQLHKLDKLPPPSNAIPSGAGGPPQGPYGMFRSDAGSGGFAFDQSAGDFASRYGWYVTAMRNRISQNWLQSTVDPNIHSAPRVYVAFQILRDGQIVNTQLTASSGVISLDRSVLRAISDSTPMQPLPPDYRGSSVAVEFWFDFRR